MEERLRGCKPANGLRGACPQDLSGPVVPLTPGYATSEPWRVIEEHRIALVAPRETRRITSLSASTIRRLVEAGNFPRPVALSRNRYGKPVRIAYVLAELERWCAERIAMGRDSSPTA
jgi:predicted DNA-binding transcriptional regulator AlpA